MNEPRAKVSGSLSAELATAAVADLVAENERLREALNEIEGYVRDGTMADIRRTARAALVKVHDQRDQDADQERGQ